MKDLERTGLEQAGKLTTKELDKAIKEYDEEKEKIKMKRREKRDPSLREIRERLKNIIKYHCKSVNEQIPSVYPILGPVNMDDDDINSKDGMGSDDSKRGGLKMLNTKQELKKY